MTIRNIALISGLAVVLGGCVVAPGPYVDRGNYRDTDSYEGYYYARVVYIDTIPYYVDDDRRARPIPPHLRDRFRYSPSNWNNGRQAPPSFGRDAGVRDGYSLSRIIYINDVPHYVEDDRRVRPLPRELNERFRYSPVVNHGNERASDERPLPLPQVQQRYEPPEPPAYGRDRDRPEPPAYGRDRDQRNRANDDPRPREEVRHEAPPLGGNERATPFSRFEHEQQHEPPRLRDNRDISPPGRRDADELRGNAPAGNAPGRSDDRSQKNNGGNANDRGRAMADERKGMSGTANPANRVEGAGNAPGRSDDRSQKNNGGNANDRGRAMAAERKGVGATANPANKVEEPRGNVSVGNGRGHSDERPQKNNGGNDKEKVKMSPEERRGAGDDPGKKEGRQ